MTHAHLVLTTCAIVWVHASLVDSLRHGPFVRVRGGRQIGRDQGLSSVLLPPKNVKKLFWADTVELSLYSPCPKHYHLGKIAITFFFRVEL